jgi:hypothetical protein
LERNQNIMKTSFTLLTFAISVNFFSQNADDIAQKHIEALGGKPAWEKITAMKKESQIKWGGAEIKVKEVVMEKKAYREDITLMGMTGYSVFKPNEGWSYFPWEGHMKPEAMTADDLKSKKDELSIPDEFFTYRELGKKLEYFGMDDIDGVDCHKLKITDKEGKQSTFYIDPENYYILKKTEKVKKNGQEQENSWFYSDYKKLDAGVVMPFSTAGNWGESETLKVEINPQVDESVFTVNAAK